MPLICHICNGMYFIGEKHICKIREEKQTDSIPLGDKIKEAMKDKKENDDE